MARPQCVVALLAAATALVLGGCAVEPLASERSEAREAALTESLLQAARNAERSLDYTKAAAHYQRLYEREPGNYQALLGQARNLRYVGTPRQSVKLLRIGLEAHGEEPPLLLELAKAQFAAALTADCLDTLQRVSKLTPDDWEVYTIFGMLYDRQENYELAREHYARALGLSPDNPVVLNNLSLSLAQAGRLDDAIETLEKLAYGEDSTLQARQNLAMLYVIRGDLESAHKLASEDMSPDRVRQNLSAYQLLAE
jgi:Flp pilus assembly protein TadD